LLSSAAAERLARKRSQRFLIRSGFAIAIAGITQLLIWGDATSNPLWLAPGLFLLGIGIGVMLTASVNTVQTSFPDEDQAEISGVSRSVSNLGSSVGVAVAGAVLISSLIAGVTARAHDSTVLTESQQAQLGDALEHQVSALSDTQVREALDGQPQPVVDEVERINRESRNQAIGFSLIAVAVAGLIGFTSAMFLPAALAAQREDDQPPPGA
jgi:hypothetical protein